MSASSVSIERKMSIRTSHLGVVLVMRVAVIVTTVVPKTSIILLGSLDFL